MLTISVKRVYRCRTKNTKRHNVCGVYGYSHVLFEMNWSKPIIYHRGFNERIVISQLCNLLYYEPYNDFILYHSKLSGKLRCVGRGFSTRGKRELRFAFHLGAISFQRLFCFRHFSLNNPSSIGKG